jgi:hypothetical protein
MNPITKVKENTSGIVALSFHRVHGKSMVQCDPLRKTLHDLTSNAAKGLEPEST